MKVKLLVLALLAALAACTTESGPMGPQGEMGVPGENGEDAIECAVPSDTLIMQFEWNSGESWWLKCLQETELGEWNCRQDAEIDYTQCTQATGQDQPGDGGCLDIRDAAYEECQVYAQENENACHFWYTKRANKIPLRTCDARVFANDGLDSLPMDEDGNTYFPIDQEEDSDGDGISNWWEFKMGYNPCTPQSFGACVDDADLDYDKDGIPDGQDPYPICNMKDPGEFQSDCV